jgi:single-strand DNA-binding protein
MSVNKVILLGNVGKDPDVRYVEAGLPVASFSLATSIPGYTASNGQQVPERTEWHNIVVWREQAKFVEQYVRRGALVYIEGSLRTRFWDDQKGRHYITEIYVEHIDLPLRRSEAAPK